MSFHKFIFSFNGHPHQNTEHIDYSRMFSGTHFLSIPFSAPPTQNLITILISMSVDLFCFFLNFISMELCSVDLLCLASFAQHDLMRWYISMYSRCSLYLFIYVFTYLNIFLFADVYTSFISNCRNLKTTQVSFIR